MIGPHYQRLAEVQQRYTSRQMLQRVQTRSENPLNSIVQKLKRVFTQYQTAYSQDIVNHQISSVDRLLSFDGKMGTVLATLQKQNNLLRRQLTVMENQLSNTVGICQQIISQNNELKNITIKKNEDIKKIIQTIALNESQQIGDLEQKVNMLQQQNAILLRHLQQVKRQHEGYSQKFINKQEQILSWKRKWQQTKKHLTQAISRQHDLSRKLTLSQQNLYQQTQSVYRLEQQNQNLKFQNNQFKNQLMLNKDQSKNLNFDNLKKKLESQYAPIVNEQRQLKKQRNQLMRQCQRVKIDNEKFQDVISDLQRKLNKVLNDLEMTTTLLNQQKQKNATMGSSISKLQARIDDLRQQNSKLLMQVQSANSYANTKQKMLHKQVDSLRKQLDQKSNETQQRLRQLKQKTRSLIEAKDIQMKSLNETNIQLRKILERQKYGSSG